MYWSEKQTKTGSYSAPIVLRAIQDLPNKPLHTEPRAARF